METIKKFEEMLKLDENLNLEYKNIIDTKDSEKMISFMKVHGVSIEDINFLLNGELSDDDLNNVAGGFPGEGLTPDELRAEKAGRDKLKAEGKKKRAAFFDKVKIALNL